MTKVSDTKGCSEIPEHTPMMIYLCASIQLQPLQGAPLSGL